MKAAVNARAKSIIWEVTLIGSKGEKKREDTKKRLWALFDQIKAENRPTGPSAFCNEAQIHRTYLYTFPELAAEVSAYGIKTQPGISRRGGAVSKTEAIKRSVDEQVRREHTCWSKEIEHLRQQHEKDQSAIADLQKQVRGLNDTLQLFKRAYETLLLFASEQGASPSELEAIQTELSSSVLNVGQAIGLHLSA